MHAYRGIGARLVLRRLDIARVLLLLLVLLREVLLLLSLADGAGHAGQNGISFNVDLRSTSGDGLCWRPRS